jgi:hypothetical protein
MSPRPAVSVLPSCGDASKHLLRRRLQMLPVDDLFELEHALDAKVLDSRLKDLPRRTVLTALLTQAHSIMYGGLESKDDPRPDVGRAVIGRCSYLLGLVDKCSEQPTASSAADAFRPFIEDPTLFIDQLFVTQYGHLCELLPEVRGGWYEVAGSSHDGFRLVHPSEDFAATEARDTVLASVTLPITSRPPANNSFFDAALRGGWTSSLTAEVRDYVRYFDAVTSEVPLFPDAGWREAFEVAENDFRQFRAFWLALSEVCLRLGEAVRRRLEAAPEDGALADEYLEWVVPYLRIGFVADLAVATTDLGVEVYDRLLEVYSHRPGGKVGGDGFFPPLHPIGDGLLFAPAAVQLMLSSRNAAYGLNRTDPKRFSGVLSAHLEPALLAKASEILDRLSGVEVHESVRYPGGEIDLLVYEPVSNAALHVQAKAPVPPQGARMTRAVEARVREGLEQLERLRDLPSEEIDRIVGSAVGSDVKDVEVLDLLLVRTCLGTHRVWAELGEVAPANLHVLAAAVTRLRERGAGLPALPSEVAAVLDEIVADTTHSWDQEKVNFGAATVEVPLLRMNDKSLRSWQSRLHRLVG